MLAKAPVLFAVNKVAASAEVICCGVDVAPVRPRLKPELLNTNSLVEDGPKSAIVFVAAPDALKMN